MGGKGKWSQPTETGFTGYDYHTVYHKRGVHFLVQHGHIGGGVSAPVMSQKPNVIYVTLGEDGKPKYISKYVGRIMKFQIDLNNHKGLYPHVHHCNEKGYRKSNEPLSEMRLNAEELAAYNRATGLFNSKKKEIIACTIGGE